MARVETKESSWSFDQIYDEYKIPIYNYVYHLVGDREQADDLTQDTFLKAFPQIHKKSMEQQNWYAQHFAACPSSTGQHYSCILRKGSPIARSPKP